MRSSCIYFGQNRLYHNNHNGTFTDVAEQAGVTLGNWSTGATWGDYDGDGRLDLFVPGYVHYEIGGASIGSLVAKLEEHGMTALGEHGSVTPEVARKIYQMAV